MDPLLVCKILVRRDDGKQVRGTGYPIADDRIITAAHVIADRVDDPDAISLLFPGSDAPLPTTSPIEILWNGEDAAPPVDVAILKCALPEHLRPGGLTLLRHRSSAPVAWQAQGYSAVAQTRMASGLHDYSGPHFPKVTARDDGKELSCHSGPERETGKAEAELWGGVSGSGIFEASGRQRLLAVVTDYVPGEKLPTLRVVPIPCLFQVDGFADAIRFEHIRHTRREHLKAARLSLVRELKSLKERIADVGSELQKLTECEVDDMRPESVAEAILNCPEIPGLLGALRRLSQITLREHASALARMAEVILPLNYAQETVDSLHHVTAGSTRFWLVEGRTKTSTLAEIIMAGFDCAPARFPAEHVSGGKAELQGPVGFDFSDDLPPNEGPDGAFQNVFNDLCQLLNVLGSGAGQAEFSDADLMTLKAELDTRRDEWGDRTTYCIVRLPQNENERRARRNVLEDVSNRVNPASGPPRLVFVEKVDVSPDNDGDGIDEEFQIQSSFRQLLLRAYEKAPG